MTYRQWTNPDGSGGGQVHELLREAFQRREVYPRWIEQGRLTQSQAALRMAHRYRAIEIVQTQAQKERLL